MIIKSIYLKEGFYEREINFSKNVNLIHSVKNSCGKTTLIRFILYALGYAIPNTRNIKFENCEVELLINIEKKGDILIKRNNLVSIQVEDNRKISTFVVPEQESEFHSFLFNTENDNLIRNILGTFYFDQEKGWTLLNRGIVIGSIHFNIEELIRGLSDIDCSTLIDKELDLKLELDKYKKMFSISKYQEKIQNNELSIITESYDDRINSELDILLIRQRELKKELKSVDSVLSDNKKIKKFIEDMKILVNIPDGNTIQLTSDKIVGLEDSIDFLISKRKNVASKISMLSNDIRKCEKERDKEFGQLTFFETASQIEVFDKRISEIPLNQIAIKQEINRLTNELKNTRQQIKQKTLSNQKLINNIFENISKYLLELGASEEKTLKSDYMFTSNLKELSGAILHKTVFAFRLSYIIAIEKKLNIKLPIILDSPSGKEVDQDNINIMMDILKRDFSDNQIIISSIFDYEFNDINKIEIDRRLINKIGKG